MAMPEYTPAPAPSKAEFNSLASDVATLNGNIANKANKSWSYINGINVLSDTKNIPFSNYNEFLITAYATDGTMINVASDTVDNIPSSGSRTYNNSYYINSTNFRTVSVVLTKTSATFQGEWHGSSLTDGFSVINIFGR